MLQQMHRARAGEPYAMAALKARDSAVSGPRLGGVCRLSLAPENDYCRSRSRGL